MNNRPKIIELVGLAGVGKSTLVKSMRQRNEEIQKFALPKSHFFWSLAKTSLLWLPLRYQSRHLTRRFTQEELLSTGCIDAWLPYLRSRTSAGAHIAVLDPGSVYWLTKLQALGSNRPEQSLYRRWVESKFEQWSTALDVIIWLDAPEELCLQRVLARDQWHDAKGMSSNEVLGRFRRLRRSYEQIIRKMASKQPKKIFYFRTDRIPTDQIINQIFSEVNLAPLRQAQAGKADPSKLASNSLM